LSRSIVELHGGRLWCESVEGQGSTFAFALPLRDLAPLQELGSATPTTVATGGDASPAEGGTAEGELVLVVEDDTASANLLAIHLRDAGYQVQITGDGRSGLEAAQRNHPRAIVLDLMLPEIDGWEVITRLKANPETADVPVIIVSIADERGKGLSLGAEDFLVKPIDPARLIEALRSLHKSDTVATRVLAIDDDPHALELIRVNLEPAGFDVLTEATGEAGFETAQRARPDVIVLDLLLPGIDGFEVAKLLKDDPITRDIPILILSSKTLSFAEKRRLLGRVEHLGRKSDFRREEFVRLVRAAVRRGEEWDRGGGV
jgi:DNA-binding response OmpR family regulator